MNVPALTAANNGKRIGESEVAAALAVLVCGTGLLHRRRRGLRGLRLLSLILPLALAAGLISGCGSSNGFAVPTATYTLTVTGTSGPTAHATTVTLTVQ